MRPLPTLAVVAPMLALALPAIAQDCADGQRPFKQSTGTTCIPEDPQRIVTLADSGLAITVIDYGFADRLVGTIGTMNARDDPFIRGASDILGVDFANTDIAFLGNWPNLDLEATAATQPDLILAFDYQLEFYDQLSRIAPTVIVNQPLEDYFVSLEEVADILGIQSQYARRRANYETRVAEMRADLPQLDGLDAVVVLPAPWAGNFRVYQKMYALSQVIDDLGLGRTDAVRAMNAQGNDGRPWADLSAEGLQGIDSDLIFTTYDPNFADLDTPEAVRASFEDMVPGYCGFLRACEADQILFVERSPVNSRSFASLDWTLDALAEKLADKTIIEIDRP